MNHFLLGTMYLLHYIYIILTSLQSEKYTQELNMYIYMRFCSVVGRVSDYRSRGPGFDFWSNNIFQELVCLERSLLSVVKIIEKVSVLV
jgi:hypothetical protein